uniref:Uncharacterized protein n=1 Tax=Oryza meridionalis TaxID=40149 RepID=A0A0E0DWH9_9ORYZ
MPPLVRSDGAQHRCGLLRSVSTIRPLRLPHQEPQGPRHLLLPCLAWGFNTQRGSGLGGGWGSTQSWTGGVSPWEIPTHVPKEALVIVVVTYVMRF